MILNKILKICAALAIPGLGLDCLPHVERAMLHRRTVKRKQGSLLNNWVLLPNWIHR